jgi:tRNA threonylcarbamoyladenosine biosynthesis protein TsaB
VRLINRTPQADSSSKDFPHGIENVFNDPILAIDTSTDLSVIAIGAPGRVEVRSDSEERGRGRLLVAAVRNLLFDLDLSPDQLRAIAVGIGPGSFTGTRVGVVAAKTLAYALGRPLIAIDTLEAIAHNAPCESDRVAVVAESHKDDMYLAEFLREPITNALRRVGPTKIVARAEWRRHIEKSSYILGPSIAKRKLIDIGFEPADSPRHSPEGRILIELAEREFAEGRFADVWTLEPAYLRRSAAEEQWTAIEPRTRERI